MKNAILFAIVFLMLALSMGRSAFAEQKAKMTAECDGESTYDQQKQLYELDKNVKLSYGDYKMQCGWLLIKIDPETKKPRSFQATGFHKNATDREKATARLNVSWNGYKISCRELEVQFVDDSLLPKIVIASGDVWMLLNNREYTVHVAKTTITSAGKDESIVDLSGDPSLPRAKIIGENFIAYEKTGRLVVKKKSFVHQGTKIEIIFDVQNGAKLLPSNLNKLKSSKLNIKADSFSFLPDKNSYSFVDSCKVKFGEFSLTCDLLDLTTVGDKQKPKTIRASSKADSKGLVQIVFKGMKLIAKTVDGSFDISGKMEQFLAVGDVEAVIIDAKDRQISANCDKAVFSGVVVSLTAKKDKKVHLSCKEEGWKGTATWVKFKRENNRWEVKTFEPHIEFPQ